MSRSEHDLRDALALPPGTAAEGRLTELIHDLADSDELTFVRPSARTARTRPRWTLGAASVAVLGLAAAVGVVVGRGSGDDAPAAGHSAPAAATSPAGPAPTSPAGPAPTAPADPAVVADTIVTPVSYGGGHLLLAFGRPAPDTIELSAGVAAGGRVVSLTPLSGPDVLQCNGGVVGFHCGNDLGGIGTDHHAWLLVGYVVGPDIQRVRIVVDGRTYEAGTQQSSENPALRAYWLAGPVLRSYPPKGSGIGTVGTMTALDGQGRIVSRTVDAIGHG